MNRCRILLGLVYLNCVGFYGGDWEEELSNGSGVNWLGYEYYGVYGNRDCESFSWEYDVDIKVFG